MALCFQNSAVIIFVEQQVQSSYMTIIKTPTFQAEFDEACNGSKKRKIQYRGKLLEPGADTAIVVTPTTLNGYINDEPVPAGHPLAARMKRHEEDIRKATAHEFGLFCREIAILGRWRYPTARDTMEFEPYIIRKTGHDGSVRTGPYDYRIFERDGLWPRVDSVVSLDTTMSGTAARQTLVSFTEAITTYPDLHEVLIGLFNLPLGVLWYPSEAPGFPLLVAEWNRFSGWNDRKTRTREIA